MSVARTPRRSMPLRHPLKARALALFGAVLWLLATDSAVGSLALATAILSRFPSCYGG
jgi:hypothetical protein